MDLQIKWFDKSFNVGLASKPGAEPFLEIKSCRIIQGKDGDFVSPPATKNDKTDKWWNHAYFSKDFAASVLAKAQESQPKAQEAKQVKSSDGFDNDVPW